MDLVIMREATEGFYVDRNMHRGWGEMMPSPDMALAVRKITRHCSMRIAQRAFELAMTRRKKVTAIHKANSFHMTDGLFLECARTVAKDFPEVEFNRSMLTCRPPPQRSIADWRGCRMEHDGPVCCNLQIILAVARQVQIGRRDALNGLDTLFFDSFQQPVTGQRPGASVVDSANKVSLPNQTDREFLALETEHSPGCNVDYKGLLARDLSSFDVCLQKLPQRGIAVQAGSCGLRQRFPIQIHFDKLVRNGFVEFISIKAKWPGKQLRQVHSTVLAQDGVKPIHRCVRTGRCRGMKIVCQMQQVLDPLTGNRFVAVDAVANTQLRQLTFDLWAVPQPIAAPLVTVGKTLRQAFELVL